MHRPADTPDAPETPAQSVGSDEHCSAASTAALSNSSNLCAAAKLFVLAVGTLRRNERQMRDRLNALWRTNHRHQRILEKRAEKPPTIQTIRRRPIAVMLRVLPAPRALLLFEDDAASPDLKTDHRGRSQSSNA